MTAEHGRIQPAADFRSDTLTRPTDEMRRAMAAAEVGDDVFGEDPTVRRLEAAAAAMLGTAAALFVPSGTMANQIAVRVHCRPGDELICEARSHVYRYEGGGAAALSGVQTCPLAAPDGFPTPAQITAAVRPDDAHQPRSRLLVIENSHNMAGGRAASPAIVAALVERAHAHRLRVHVDGARLVNAAVACGCEPSDLTRGVDSVAICLSKGMGAPVGSLIAGSAEFVAAAHRLRKMLGGGMRQAGVLAAAGLLALSGARAQAARDHALARQLVEGLAGIDGLRAAPVETNIVMVDLERVRADDLAAQLARRGVGALAVTPSRLRLVTHRDVGDADVAACIAAVGECLAACSLRSNPRDP
jgi:threonine aldolase